MKTNWLKILLFACIWIFGFAVGFWTNKHLSKPIIVYQKIVDTLRIWDTVYIYVGNEFRAKKCEEIQWKNQFMGGFSSGIVYSQSSFATQTMPSWGLGLHVMYDFQSQKFSPIFSVRYRNYFFWVKPTNTYGVGFGIQF